MEEKIDVKIETEEIAFWMQVKTQAEMEIKALERSLKMNNAILEMAELKIAEERALEDSTG